jgi:hypothetical protein
MGNPKTAAVGPIRDLAWRVRRHYECWREVRRISAGSSPPVLIYQMAKGASTTILKSLERVGVHATQVHLINPDTARHIRSSMRAAGISTARMDIDIIGRAVRRGIIGSGRGASVINVVREPVGRNVSLYFQILDRLWQTDNAHEKVGLDRLLEGFHTKFNHDRTLDWFDQEFKPVLGVDVYEHDFPREQGWLRIDAGRYNILLMRVDLADVSKEKVLSEFLGVEGLKLSRENVGSQKPYARVYRDFLRALELSENYVDRMLDSRYARHFFTDEERRALRSKWLGAGDAALAGADVASPAAESFQRT